MLLEGCVASEYYGIALSVAFALGKIAADAKGDIGALRKRFVTELSQSGGDARGAQSSDEADKRWRNEARPIWQKNRGQFPEGDRGAEESELGGEKD